MAKPRSQHQFRSILTFSHSYFVVMIDYGSRGREAIVDPEITRRGVVERVASREYQNIAFIHHVSGTEVTDVTEEIVAEAGVHAMECA